ncbi:DUF1307 domain-containing protein [Salinicoccus halitifaciens]|uniref:Uncharacterized lipoprotein YehR (DUF1307 family) n=1 Tax=Salinicoccus halitifaciens TaxID=1073415 RepID=A0ABV2E916_9STAP|nr:DUF1307 domain-containing protein [Salinicoccus halitifaciens]MCD2137696.1 YehR family protein [Salinicoccus halitifaciens]
MKNLLKLCTIGGMALVIAACGNGEDAAIEESDEVEEGANSPGDPVTEEEEVGEGESDSSDGTEEDATSEEESKTFVYEQEGYVNELVYYYIGDEVQRQTSETEMTYEALGVAGEEEAREALDAIGAQYNEVEGVTQSIEYGEEGIVEKLEVDYSVANIGDIVNLEEESFEEDASEADYISMEDSEEQLLEEGYELVEE